MTSTEISPDISPELGPELSPELSQETVTAVLREINGLGRALKDLARPELAGGLHMGALLMLGLLDQLGQARCSEVAERTGLDVSVVSRQLSALDGLGLTARVPDPSDGRAWLSHLTLAGEGLLADLRSRTHRQLAAALSGWTEDELRDLLRQLARLNTDLLHSAHHLERFERAE